MTAPSSGVTFFGVSPPPDFDFNNTLIAAAREIDYAQGLVLRGSGCGAPSFPGYVAENCSATCQSVVQAFSSPSTFENCLAYPVLTRALGGELSDRLDDVGPRSMWGILPNDTAGAEVVFQTMTACIRGYGESLPDCRKSRRDGCPLAACDTLLAANSTTYGPQTFDCISAICQSGFRSAAVNAEIGGLGVQARPSQL